MVDHNNVAITITPKGVQAVDPATGKGILWSTASQPSVANSAATVSGPSGLQWKYQPTRVGIKASATVSKPLGGTVLSFPYSLVGGAAPLKVTALGVQRDGFFIPPPVAVGCGRRQELRPVMTVWVSGYAFPEA